MTEWRDRMSSAGTWLEARAGVAASWSLHEVLGMLNPFRRLKRSIAIVMAAITLAVRLWALVYRALAYIACDPRRGVFGATKHPDAVRRFVYLAFVAAVSLKCAAEGRSLAYLTWICAIAAVGGTIGDRRANRGLRSHGGLASAPDESGPGEAVR